MVDKQRCDVTLGQYGEGQDLEALKSHIRAFWSERGLDVDVHCSVLSPNAEASNCERLDPEEYWQEFVTNPAPNPGPSPAR